MSRRLLRKRRHLRQLVRDYIFEAIEQGPVGSSSELETRVVENLSEDFTDSPFFALLIEILKILLPLLLGLLEKDLDARQDSAPSLPQATQPTAHHI